MPIVNTIPPLTSPPTNVFGLYQFLAQRLPGYDPTEYIRELNSAYIHVWEEVSKLEDNYFTKIKTLTVAQSQSSFDLQYNADGGLSGVLSNRLYQVTRIRVLPPQGGIWQTTRATHPNDPQFLAVAGNPSAAPTNTGPYPYYQFGRNNIQFPMPIMAGSTLEFVYTFWPLALTLQYGGTVSSSGSTVTGSATAFTQLLQPDFQMYLPQNKGQEEILVELVCNNNQIYNVATISSDTALTTLTPIAPVLTAGSQYAVAVLPEIPREHIRVIASVAMGKMYSIDGDDQRVSEWTAIAEKNIQMMKDSLQARQIQTPPRKVRFPYGIQRGNRGFIG